MQTQPLLKLNRIQLKVGFRSILLFISTTKIEYSFVPQHILLTPLNWPNAHEIKVHSESNIFLVWKR